VLLKVEMQDVSFALYIHGAPPGGTHPRELEPVLAQYGRLHATKICAIKSSDNVYFVNYSAYECAYECALAALEAARGRTLRFKGATLYANAARNKTLLAQLTADLRASGRFSFFLDDESAWGRTWGRTTGRPRRAAASKSSSPQSQPLALSGKEEDAARALPDAVVSSQGRGVGGQRGLGLTPLPRS
jgi:hypothetical protein